jgi:hypothetical protein
VAADAVNARAGLAGAGVARWGRRFPGSPGRFRERPASPLFCAFLNEKERKIFHKMKKKKLAF